jgi:hypothetical protein
LARNGTDVTTGNARSVERELKLYQTDDQENHCEKKVTATGSAGRLSVTITALHKMAVTAENFRTQGCVWEESSIPSPADNVRKKQYYRAT